MRKIEQQLIQGLLSRDRDTFDMLFKSYYSALVYVAGDILHDSMLAEEVVQDVFVKLWTIGPDLVIRTSLSAYLIEMVRNRSIDYLRANKRRIRTVSIENQEVRLKLHELGVDSSFEDELFSSSLELALKQAIEQLPSQCRQIFILNRFEGYSPKEIADQLQISVHTVKAQITRALQKLKNSLPSK